MLDRFESLNFQSSPCKKKKKKTTTAHFTSISVDGMTSDFVL